MPQRVKPVTRLVGGSLSTSMTGVGVVGVTAQEVTGAGAHAVSVGVASSGSGSAVIPGAAYTLADATTGLPFVVNQPIAPQGTLTVTPVTPANIGSFLGGSGRQLVLSGDDGPYGNLTISGTDLELVLTTGVTIGTLSISGQRIVVKADPVRSGNIRRISSSTVAQDVLLDGITSDIHGLTGGAETNDRNFLYGTRMALINSHIRVTGYCFYSDTNTVYDLIIANCKLHSNGPSDEAGSGVRLMAQDRFVFVDNNVIHDSSSRATARFHNATTTTFLQSCIRRNQFEGTRVQVIAGGGGNPPTNGYGEVWFDDNTNYTYTAWTGAIGQALDTHIGAISNGQPIVPGQFPWNLEVLRMSNNRAYGGDIIEWLLGVEAPWEIAGNNTVTNSPAWDGTVPTWEFQ